MSDNSVGSIGLDLDLNLDSIKKDIQNLSSQTGQVSKSIKNSINGSLNESLKASDKSAKNLGNDINSKINKSLKNTENGAEKVKSKFGGMGKVVGALGIGVAIEKIKEFAKSCVEGADAAETINVKADALLKKNTGASDKQIEKLKDLEAQQSTTGVVSKGAQTAMAGTLSTYLNSTGAIKKMIPSLDDLNAKLYGTSVTAEQSSATAKMLGKSLSTGGAKSLARVGIVMNDTTAAFYKNASVQTRSIILTDMLKRSVGGMNKKLGETSGGKLVIIQNQINALKNKIGTELLPIIVKVGGYIATKVLPKVSKGIDGLTPKLKKAVDFVNANVVPIFNKIYKMIEKIMAFAKKNSTVFKIVAAGILGMVAAINALIAVEKVYTAVTTAQTAAIRIQTAAQGILDAVLNANPISLIVIGVTALIAAMVLLYVHVKPFRDVVNSIFSAIKTGFTTVISFFKNVIKFIKKNWKDIGLLILNPFVGAFNLLYKHCAVFRNFINGFLSGIKSAFSKTWGFILKMFSAGGSIFKNIKNGIGSAIKAVLNLLISGLNAAFNTPIKIVNSLLNRVRKLKILGKSPFASLYKSNPLPSVKIPKLANGGALRANAPQLAIVGDNKNEGEIVAPESKLSKMAKNSSENTLSDLLPYILKILKTLERIEKNDSNKAILQGITSTSLYKIVKKENTIYKKQYGTGI